MKKFFNKIIVALVTIIITTYTSMSFAVTQNDLKNKQEEQEGVSNNIKQTEKELENVQQEKKDTLSQVEDLTNQIEDYQSQIDKLDTQISELEEKIKQAEAQIAEDEKKQQERQKLLNDRLVAVYENGEMSYLDVLLSSNNIMDFISGYYLLSEITKYDNELLNQIEQDKQKIENEKAEIETDKAELDTSKKTKEAKENALKVAKKDKEAKVDELSEDEKKLQEELDELKAYESSIKNEVERLKQEYDKQNSKPNSGSSSNSGATNSYGFGLPLKGNIHINTYFGEKGSSWSSGRHTGIDFRAQTPTPIYSVGDGIVVEAGWQSSYGNHVAIYHGNNIYSFYAHASSLKVSVGETVTKGQEIMISGATGNVTGPHLHFEIRKGSNSYSSCVDPMPYLPL